MTVARARTILVASCASLAVVAASTAAAGSADATLRDRIAAAYAHVHSYKLTVLGSVRSTGVWVAPDRYHMTTDIGGKPLETVIVGNGYWTKSGGRWMRAGTTSSNLDIDVAALLRTAKTHGTPFKMLAPQTADGKTLGTFSYATADGGSEICNYDRSTYRVLRCKADQVTILYSGFNAADNVVPRV